MDFCALDVETANANFASICQIGISKFRDGEVQDSFESLINPKCHFDSMNIEIHGITNHDVKHAPTLSQLWEQVFDFVGDDLLVSHSSFDRGALMRACDIHNLELIQNNWVDTMRVVRRTWSQYQKSGYGLKSVASNLGIEFQHHNAAEDAWACGQIFIAAINESEVSAEQWIKHQTKRNSSKSIDITNEHIDETGPFYGQNIVFTGALTIPRIEAATIAAKLGFQVGRGVNKKTDVLVVGDQDLTKLNGHEKSSKQRKVEALINNGSAIRILGESDFQTMINLIPN